MKKLFTLSLALFVFVAMSVYAQDVKKDKDTKQPPAKVEVKKDTTKVKAEVKKAACTDKKAEAKKDTLKKEAPKKK